jgi:hypothetical protein
VHPCPPRVHAHLLKLNNKISTKTVQYKLTDFSHSLQSALKQKTNSVALVRKRTLRPSERRLSEKLVPNFADKGCRVVSTTDPHGRFLSFLHWSRYYFFQVAPQLYSRG